MMRSRLLAWCGGTMAALLLAVPPASAQAVKPDAEGFITARPGDMVPASGSQTVLYGNPSEPGLYVVRITFAPGRGSRPHFHDQARFITVIKGTWWVSLGARADVYDPDHMTPVPAGSFLYEPPNGHHYDMAKDEEVTVQIMGIGPVRTTQIPQEPR